MKKVFLVALFLIIFQKSHAGVGIEVSRDISDKSIAHNALLSLSSDAFVNPETESVGLHNFLKYSFSNALDIINLNSNLSDFEISSITHSLSYEATLFETLTASLKYNSTKFNVDEAAQTLSSMGLYYQLGDFQIGATTSNSDTYEVKDALVKVLLVTRNYKDEIKFNQKGNSYFLNARWTKNFMTSVNYSIFTYDKNLNTSYAFLTTIPFLNGAGGAVVGEIAGLIKNSTDFNMSLLVNEVWLFNLGLGTAVDYLDPSTKTNNANLGVDYEFEYNSIYYRVFGLADFSKSADSNDTSNSSQIGVSLNF